MSIPETYVDTALIECNRKTSPQYLAGNDENPHRWTNDCGSGIKLNVGDKISVHSAYVSEIGNENATIEIKGSVATDNLNRGQTYNSSDTLYEKTTNVDDVQGAMLWEYFPKTQTNMIRDDKINLTHSYYKNANGEYYVMLPRSSGWKLDTTNGFLSAPQCWNEYNSFLNGKCNGVNPYRFESDYNGNVKYYGGASPDKTARGAKDDTEGVRAERHEICNDGARYTIFTKTKNFNWFGGGDLEGHRDPAFFEYKWYKRTHPYEIDKGFNSPINVAESFTNQMTDIRSLTQTQQIDGRYVDVPNRNFNLVGNSRVNEPFPCGFGAGFNEQVGNRYFGMTNVEGTDFRGIVYNRVVRDMASHRGRENNMIDITVITDIVVGMFVVGGSAIFDSIKGAKVIKLGVASDPGLHPTTCVCLDREIPEYVDGDTILFSWHGSDWGTAPETGSDHPYENNTHDFYYQSCYATIGYKRPEIQEAGRFLDNNARYTRDGSGGILVTTNYPLSDPANPDPNNLITDWEWTDTNLELFRQFFKSQKHYPELFEYENMSTQQQELINASNNFNLDKARWLHCNTYLTLQAANVKIIVGTAGGTAGEIHATFKSGGNLLMKGMMVCLESEYGLLPMGDSRDQTASNHDRRRTFVLDFYPDGADYIVVFSQPLMQDLVEGDEFVCTEASLGGDQYYAAAGDFANSLVGNDRRAGMLPVDFNSAREDITEGIGDGAVPYDNLWGGFARRYLHTDGKYYIGLWYGGPHNDPTQSQNLVNQNFFQNGRSELYGHASFTIGGATRTLLQCPIGFDLHFNDYGTCAMMMWNGLAGEYGVEFSNASKLATNMTLSTWQDRTDPSGEPKNLATSKYVQCYSPAGFLTNPIVNEIYLGANDPALTFNGSQSRFQFNKLHTAEMVGTSWDSAEPPDDATNICYKVNKRLSRLNWSPTFIPYGNTSCADAGNTRNIYLDENIVPYTIMDAHSGIFFEDYGCNEKYWNKSLWELLGFSYEQFHQDTNNRLIRTHNLGLTTSTPTTNAEVNTADFRNFGKVYSGSTTASSVYNTTYEPERIPTPHWDFFENPTGAHMPATDTNPALYGLQNFVEIVQSCSSVNITADNLPRKMMSPIYCIKSDILAPTYIGGQKGTSKLPVVAVVPKDNGYGDFYTGMGSDIFTNTHERTIQNIHIDICDADGTGSRVDDSSCVIFKIQKNITSNANIVEEIMNDKK